eukprot:scaffold6295_cov340-Ochromonas_danica.AAC.1
MHYLQYGVLGSPYFQSIAINDRQGWPFLKTGRLRSDKALLITATLVSSGRLPDETKIATAASASSLPVSLFGLRPVK